MKLTKKLAAKAARFARNKRMRAILAIGAGYGLLNSVMAQNPGAGVTGLTTAETSLRTYVDPVCNIVMVIGGIVGLVGAIRVFSKWQNGDQDVTKSLMAWLGSCVFLVVGALVVKAFFGLG
jgi:hypothetical protein